MSILKEWNGRSRIYIPTCDICGAQLHEEYDFDDAVEARKEAGWKTKKINGEWFDFCEDCRFSVSPNGRKEECHGE